MNVPTYKQTEYGFYQLDPMPTEQELINYYSQAYYKDAPQNLVRLQHEDSEEIFWLENTIWLDINNFLFTNLGGGKLLDYGSGTGHFARFARDKEWEVTEYDLAKDHAPTYLDDEFNAITMLHVLEHVRDPRDVLDAMYAILVDNGILVVTVPNDFSPLQTDLQKTYGQYWLRYLDHISYFQFDTLAKLLNDVGFEVIRQTTDFPMEIFLLFNFNYLEHKFIGNACHQRRRTFEISLSTEIRNQLYATLSTVGIGRNIIMFAKKK